MAEGNGRSGGPQQLVVYSSLYALAGGYSLTRDQLRQGTEAVVDAVNELIEAAGKKKEAVANLVFRASFGNNVTGALSTSRRVPPIYRELQKRAGASLGIEAEELSVFLRIGALNHGEHGDAWNTMRWSKKVALLPLVKDEKKHHLFARGVDFANGPNVGVRHVRKWVSDALTKALGTAPDGGQPEPVFKLKAGEKLLKHAIPLDSPKARKGFAKDVNALPPAERRKMKRDILRVAKNMMKMAGDIDD